MFSSWGVKRRMQAGLWSRCSTWAVGGGVGGTLCLLGWALAEWRAGHAHSPRWRAGIMLRVRRWVGAAWGSMVGGCALVAALCPKAGQVAAAAAAADGGSAGVGEQDDVSATGWPPGASDSACDGGWVGWSATSVLGGLGGLASLGALLWLCQERYIQRRTHDSGSGTH